MPVQSELQEGKQKKWLNGFVAIQRECAEINKKKHIRMHSVPIKPGGQQECHFYLPSNTSGAIHAALPLLLVMWVWISQAVPKSQIFSTVPPATRSRLEQTMEQIKSIRKKELPGCAEITALIRFLTDRDSFLELFFFFTFCKNTSLANSTNKSK